MKKIKTNSFGKISLLFFTAFFFFPAIGSTGDFDFVFHIPVEVKELHPDVTKISVSIRVSKSKIWNDNAANLIGLGQQQPYQHLVVQNGSFKGNVTLKFNASIGKNPAEARSYRVQMHFKYRGQWFKGDEILSQNIFPLSDTAPFTWEIKGKMPVNQRMRKAYK